jgi:hypothetical protein
VGRRAIPGETDLATTHPELAAQLVDQALAAQLLAGSGRKVEWRCDQGHEWTAIVGNRRKGYGCPYCSGRLPVPGTSDLSTTHPELAAELQDLTMAVRLSAGSTRRVGWRCSQGHEWPAEVASRAVRGAGCPYCSGRLPIRGETDLATTHPDVAATLVDFQQSTEVSAGSAKVLWWECPTGHEYEARVFQQVRSRGCPHCAPNNARVLPGFNDLATSHPEIARQLVDQELATRLVAMSNRRLQWICDLGHDWTAQVSARAQGRGCPYCSNQKAWPGFNDLLTSHPGLAAELVQPELGAVLLAGSNRKVQWRCTNGHVWTAKVNYRASGYGCPECTPGGFSPLAESWLYLLATPGRTVYKFGITNVLENRLANHSRQGFTEVVETIYFDFGADAAEAERRIKAYVKAQGWQPPMTAESMPYGGASETLSVHDVGEGFTLSMFLAD